jgi:hypothetical protein
VVQKLEKLTEPRVLSVDVLCGGDAARRSNIGVVEVARAAQDCGIQMSNVALPLVALMDAGRA